MSLHDDGRGVTIRNHTIGTNTALIAASANETITIKKFQFSTVSTGTITLHFGTGSTNDPRWSASIALNIDTGLGRCNITGDQGDSLYATMTGGGAFDGRIEYEIRKVN